MKTAVEEFDLDTLNKATRLLYRILNRQPSRINAQLITTANTLSVSAQFGLPDWVRARGMSMYQMAIMGASASGAAIWGQLATHYTIHISLVVAAITGGLLGELADIAPGFRSL